MDTIVDRLGDNDKLRGIYPKRIKKVMISGTNTI